TVLGQALTLRGQTDGERVRVAVVRLDDPAKGAPPFEVAPAGHRFVAVVVRVTNTGTTRYRDAPSNGAVLVVAGGRAIDAELLDEVEPALGSVDLAPGESAEGWVTFAVPSNDTPALVRITPDSGFAPDSGEWRLPS